MATRRVLRDTVVLSNYAGEVNDVATYQHTILEHCYCSLSRGVTAGGQGKNPNDNSRLYVFDYGTVAKDTAGNVRTYLPFDEWKTLVDKTAFWTLAGNGKDYFTEQNTGDKIKVVSFAHLVSGSRRMWHFEVTGK